MTMTLEKPYPYPGFFLRDREELTQKEDIAQEAGRTGLMLVVDFDKTLTTNGPKDLTSWDAATPFLTPESQQKDREMCAEYIPLEEQGKMTEEMADYWWNETLGLYVKDKVRIDDIRSQARQSI
ncbi:MAG TPA: hypothetical protein VLA92_03880, partial [Candidatus Saccharimonadales bacterium]|nr:hypothetical protein [Candidatus Saccharimonadales bacterium]